MPLPNLIVVTPTYNEAASIGALVEGVAGHVPYAHMLVVDDGSPDGTADIAERCMAGRPGMRVLRRSGARGFGRSYVEGLLAALDGGYDLIAHMDADLSHDPASLPALVSRCASCDMTAGSRYCPGGSITDWPRRRRALSRWANAYVHLVTGLPLRDATSGFRCWRRDALAAVDLASVRSDGYSFLVETACRAHHAGASFGEEPILFRERRYGRSKMTVAVMAEAAVLPWRMRGQRR